MATTIESLSLTETIAPTTPEALAEAIADAHGSVTPVYPIGGGTSLDYGLPAKQPGVGLSLAGLNRVVDYPDRDMTITVEAGITMAALAEQLAAHRQRLPIDAPLADRATLGGVLATATSGPRRYGQGTVRDYVIGIRAVDGRGQPFAGGGRVVKNVAGYDFCKLLTGSLGTLGVVTQVTLKVKPRPEASAFVACCVTDLVQAERLLAGLIDSATTPVAIELLSGPSWDDDRIAAGVADGPACLIVGLEGTAAEVDWMVQRLVEEWRAAGVVPAEIVQPSPVKRWWSRLTEFPAETEPSGSAPLVIKGNVLPSAVTFFVQMLRDVDPGSSILAHAGNGIVIARMSKIEGGDASHLLITRLQPAAVAAGGNVIVLSCPAGDLTRPACWGAVQSDRDLMLAIKQQFDPSNILNRGRFLF